MGTFKWIAIDFDETICDNMNHPKGERFCKPIPHAKEALEQLQKNGWRIMIHSCNRKKWIEEWMDHWDIPFEAIWTDPGKPACDWFVDDRAIHFNGDWMDTLNKIGGQVGKD